MEKRLVNSTKELDAYYNKMIKDYGVDIPLIVDKLYNRFNKMVDKTYITDSVLNCVELWGERRESLDDFNTENLYLDAEDDIIYSFEEGYYKKD